MLLTGTVVSDDGAVLLEPAPDVTGPVLGGEVVNVTVVMLELDVEDTVTSVVEGGVVADPVLVVSVDDVTLPDALVVLELTFPWVVIRVEAVELSTFPAAPDPQAPTTAANATVAAIMRLFIGSAPCFRRQL